MMVATPDPQHYIPSNAVLEHIKGVTLAAVVGPTGAGKTTLMNQAVVQDPEVHFVLTDVSRAPRPEERDGVDYNFRSRQEMQHILDANEYVQVAVHASGDLYATRPDSYSLSGVNMMALLAEAMPNFRHLPFGAIRTIFIVPPDFETWQGRIGRHDFSAEQRLKRLGEAERSFAFALHDEQTQFVINADLIVAQADFMTLLHAQALSPRLQADQSKARQIVAEIVERLSFER